MSEDVNAAPAAAQTTGAEPNTDVTQSNNAPVTTGTPEATSTPETQTQSAPASEQAAEGTKGQGKGTELPSELYFQGQAVEVDIPSDIQSALEEAGADTGKIIAELFSKDSTWELSEETRKPLDAKFGRSIVDHYLAMANANNKATFAQHKSQAEAQAKAEQEAIVWSDELIGGEGKWDMLNEWADGALTDEEFNDFNAAMQSGNRFIQKLAIESMRNRWAEEVGDIEVNLIPADTAGAADPDNAPLSSEAYINAISQLSALPKDERRAAEAKLDARRRAGMARGI